MKNYTYSIELGYLKTHNSIDRFDDFETTGVALNAGRSWRRWDGAAHLNLNQEERYLMLVFSLRLGPSLR